MKLDTGKVGPEHGGGVVEAVAGTNRIDRRGRFDEDPQPVAVPARAILRIILPAGPPATTL